MFFCVKRFRPIIRVAKNRQEKLTILHVPHIGSLCYLDLENIRDFVIRKLVGKQGINIHAALQRFREI